MKTSKIQKNLQLQKDLLSAQVQALQEANFGSSASSLEQAASSLNTAADKITAAYSAGGFVPNYASVDGVERALRTERAMGAKRPVVDSHPSIGRYVRDAATQSNFAAVKRDHPEGIKRATENSKNIQKAKAKGFTPNFFDSIFLDDSGEYNKVALASTGLFGLGYLAKKEFFDTPTRESKPFPRDFIGTYLRSLESLSSNKINNYKTWRDEHRNVRDSLIDEDDKKHRIKAGNLIDNVLVREFNPLLVAKKSNELGYLSQPILQGGSSSVNANAPLHENAKYLSIYNSILGKGVDGLSIEDLYKVPEGNTFYMREQIAKKLEMYRKGGEFKLPFSTFKSDGSLDYNNTPTFYTSKILQDLKNSILQKAGIEKITQREDEILDIIDKSQEYIENTSDVSWQHAPDYFDLNFNKVNPAGSDPYLLIKARNKLLVMLLS